MEEAGGEIELGLVMEISWEGDNSERYCSSWVRERIEIESEREERMGGFFCGFFTGFFYVRV